MKKAKDILFIHNELRCSIGSSESSSVTLVTDLHTGKSELVIRKEYTERYRVKDYDTVMELYEGLNRGGGRHIPKLKDLTK